MIAMLTLPAAQYLFRYYTRNQYNNIHITAICVIGHDLSFLYTFKSDNLKMYTDDSLTADDPQLLNSLVV